MKIWSSAQVRKSLNSPEHLHTWSSQWESLAREHFDNWASSTEPLDFFMSVSNLLLDCSSVALMGEEYAKRVGRTTHDAMRAYEWNLTNPLVKFLPRYMV